MAMVTIDEHFLISELKCLISSSRNKTNRLSDQQAVESILWETIKQIAATKSNVELDRDLYERIYKNDWRRKAESAKELTNGGDDSVATEDSPW